ncbi:hypothetical protein M3Y96_01207400 [Aphelenchoides besseyi]|nr:hypothetical protein M3Y96_01207400 [Aphelenchoides besseyi]
MADFYEVLVLIGIFAGFFVNFVLLWNVLKNRRNVFMKQYNDMVMVEICWDLFFSMEQLFSQHSLIIMNGVIMFHPSGAERFFVQTNWLYCSFFCHIFTFCVSMMIQPSLFHYLQCAFVGGTTAVVGVYQLRKRSPEYLRDLLLSMHYDQIDEVYAVDTQDISTFIYVFFGIVIGVASIYTTLFYGYNSYRHLQYYAQEAENHKLQRQFTFCLAAQAFVSIFFGILPVCTIVSMAFFHRHFEFRGLLVPSAFLSFANAVLPLSLVTAYRDSLKSMLLTSKPSRIQPN